MLRRAAVDTHGLALETQLTGVASRAGDIQKHIRAPRILVPGKACREVAGVVRCRFLARVHQETEAGEVFGGGEALLREGQFEGGEPVVAQAFDLSALGCEVIGLAIGGAPLLQVMHLLCRRPGRQFRVGDVVKNHGHDQPEQYCDENQQAKEEAQDKHPCRIFMPLCPSPQGAARGHYARYCRFRNEPASEQDERSFISRIVKCV
ncbi:hypothetical protein D3C81_1506290 [compost metagenome]